MNLLITGAWANAGEHIEEIRNMGHTVVFLRLEQDALPCPYDWVEGVVCNGLFLYHPIRSFPNLCFIQLTSAGLDRVDIEYVKSRSITIRNARGVYSIPMAEFAVCGVLQLYKQSRFFLENRAARRWEKHRGLLELCGKAVAIVGCGSVGTECAKRFQAFGCRVLGVDLYPRETECFELIYPLSNLETLLPKADILLLTLPLTRESFHLMDCRRLGLMKPTAVIVNISRGQTVDETALCDALRSRRIAGAVLDVFEHEPLEPDSPLWESENVILSPHNSFVGEGNGDRLSSLIMDNLAPKL